MTDYFPVSHNLSLLMKDSENFELTARTMKSFNQRQQLPSNSSKSLDQQMHKSTLEKLPSKEGIQK